jgi:hypothetical protein
MKFKFIFLFLIIPFFLITRGVNSQPSKPSKIEITKNKSQNPVFSTKFLTITTTGINPDNYYYGITLFCKNAGSDSRYSFHMIQDIIKVYFIDWNFKNDKYECFVNTSPNVNFNKCSFSKDDTIGIEIETPQNKYFVKNLMLDVISSDTISYILDYGQLSFKEGEKQEENISVQPAKEYMAKLKYIGDGLVDFFNTKVNHKTYNWIADYCYDLDFNRKFYPNSTWFTKYYYFDNNGELTEYNSRINNNSIKIDIVLQFSYGYGKLDVFIHYDIDFVIDDIQGSYYHATEKDSYWNKKTNTKIE